MTSTDTQPNAYAPDFTALPETLAIFPLTGVLLLPEGQLPLNIFEPRYKAMLLDAMAGSRMIGMVQPREKGTDKPPVYDIGCAGKVIEFFENRDGTFQITLHGICRFRIARELQATTLYRQVQPAWAGYEKDLQSQSCLGLDRTRLADLLGRYFEHQGMTCDWSRVEEASDNRLITCLSMICPFDPCEKQALLEVACCKERGAMFMTLLEMAVREGRTVQSSSCHH